jgi:peroxiredoxin
MTRPPSFLRRTRRPMLVLLAMAGTSACAGSAEVRAPAIGASAPAFEAMDLSGAPVTLASLKGRVVVLNVWATWCRPCLEEIPQLEAVHRDYGPKGVTTVGVSIDAAGMGADVKDFMDEHGMTYAVWLDPDRNFSLKFLTVGVPETFVLDREGTITWRMIGAIRPGDSTFAAAISDALRSQ